MTFAQRVAEDQRLRILQLLAEDPAGSHNVDIVAAGLEMAGHAVSRDRVHSHADWLAEQGLVRIESEWDPRVLAITRRGLDVARGRVAATGVARPLPE